MAGAAATPAGSSFVTVMAKVSLVLGVATTLYAVLQVAAAAVFLRDEHATLLLDFIAAQSPPAWALWVMSHLTALAVALLVLCLVFVAVSLGLLRRRAWGWWGFVGFMVVGAVANFAGIAVVEAAFSWAQALPAEPDMEDLEAELEALRTMTVAMLWMTALVFAVLHGLIVWQLCRPQVRREFGIFVR